MVQIRRTRLVLENPPHHHRSAASQEPVKVSAPLPEILNGEEASVLVINASHEMAKEITLQLTLKMPGCSIMYAPTVEIAKWILKKRKIDLVVSSPILPDGSITKLKDTIETIENPPDLVVVGEMNIRSAEAITNIGYEYTVIRKLPSLNRSYTQPPVPVIHKRRVDDSIKNLGADIRNDLNNPLQEIVAMVFVAKASGHAHSTDQALEAIDKAAKNLAEVVSGLEDKIRGAVTPLSVAS